MNQCQGGKMEEQKDSAGKVKTVVWEATGEGIFTWPIPAVYFRR